MMNNSDCYDFMRISDLKTILSDLPDEMLVVIPVVDENDVNRIFAFRKVRTAGILGCETEIEKEVLCLNGAADRQDIADQIHFSGQDVDVLNVLYGKSRYDEEKEMMKREEP